MGHYNGSRLDAVHFDLSPNLSPTRREALILTPLPCKGRGWGLGFSAVDVGATEFAAFALATYPVPVVWRHCGIVGCLPVGHGQWS